MTRNKSATNAGGMETNGGGGALSAPGGANNVRKTRAMAGVIIPVRSTTIQRLWICGLRE